jgi:hypothetical protein
MGIEDQKVWNYSFSTPYMVEIFRKYILTLCEGQVTV